MPNVTMPTSLLLVLLLRLSYLVSSKPSLVSSKTKRIQHGFITTIKVSLHIRGLLRVFTPPETPCETHGEQHRAVISLHLGGKRACFPPRWREITAVLSHNRCGGRAEAVLAGDGTAGP